MASFYRWNKLEFIANNSTYTGQQLTALAISSAATPMNGYKYRTVLTKLEIPVA
jgi:hypothetical protein